MDRLRFGPAGVPISSPKRSTEEGIKTVHNLGLDCMEIEFVQRVSMSEETALRVNEVKEKYDVELTVHAPYYINLNSTDREKLEASKKRIIDAAKIGYLAGATSVTFHAAFYGKDNPKVVYNRVKRGLMDILEVLEKEGIKIDVRPETTGKQSQFGSLEEIIELSKELPGVLPCVDFAHIYARYGGRWNTYEEFVEILNKLERGLGRDILENMHIHVSGILFGSKGEKEHLVFENSDFNYRELMRAFHDKGIKGCVICESPILEEDTILLKNVYEEIGKGKRKGEP
jgi:deoxyribonuclease-4